MKFEINYHLLLISPLEEDVNFFQSLLPNNVNLVSTDSRSKAIRILTRQHIDIICCEVHQKNFEGIGLLNEVRTLFPDIPFMFIYQKVSTQTTIQAIDLGINRFLKKPLQPQLTLDTINILVKTAKRRYSSEKMSLLYIHNFYQIVTKSDLQSIYRILETVDNLMNLIYQGQVSVLPEVKTAIYEGLVNASEHGNKDPEKKIYFTIEMRQDRIIVHIKDQGKGFDYKRYLSKSKNKENYGLQFIDYLMDEITFNQKGNELSMLKII